MSKKEEAAGDALDFSGMPPAAVTASDIQQKEFRVSRFGGYKMRDVDEFLDQVTEAMTKLADENQRLRAASGLPAAAAIGAPDLDDRARQADEIIARARAEAAQILQEARSQATASPGSANDRGAVGPFLSQEREFLQQLAALVQGHAESVKGMVKATRTKPSEVAVEGATSERAVPQPDPEPPARTEVDTQPIRVERPAPASVPGGDPVDESRGLEAAGDPSLRELFWGED